ncbi:whirlin isoform X3 [Nematostella vectensis]|uniref:whirlin isoform X3 n=1 Tax=Nematostella vectensis TaxID=45351 RepID=UPI002076E80C|nr:whirlin isoform X3 [Nematostella vectensis]
MSTPRRAGRNISESVRHLHNTLTKILSDQERAYFIQSLNRYQRNRDVDSLVASLKTVLNSPKKRQVFPILREIIPSRDRHYFDKTWQGNRAQLRPVAKVSSTRSRSRSPSRSPRRLRRNIFSASLPDLNKYDSGIDMPNGTTSRTSRKYPIRKLQIKRPQNCGFGFCMRGGSEHGVGLYVSSIDTGSVSEAIGLLPGDHILAVNDVNFDGLTHDQAVKIIRSSKKLSVVVRSVGRIPNTFVAEATYRWIDPRGNQIPAPPNVDSSGRSLSADGIHKSDLRLLGDDDERKVNVFVEDGGKLGLKIRGGAEYGLGIYIAGVDEHSAASWAGLKCGDQIMDVNGTSFLNISHASAIKALKANKNMMVTIKDVGRLPLAKTTTDKTRWSKGQTPNGKVANRPRTNSGHWGMQSVERPEKSKFQHGIAGTQLIYHGTGPSTKNLTTEQAKQVLNENELGTMTYYIREYTKGWISVDAFVLALFDLLSSPSKLSLLSEIRGVIAAKDIDRFDDLVLKKEIQAMKARRTLYSPEDANSLRSYNSSLSSFSGHGSFSSRSSAKESYGDADSRPITPPRVPDVLPSHIKTTDDLHYPPVPWPHIQENNEESSQTCKAREHKDSDASFLPPPPESNVMNLHSENIRMTNGEITENEVIGESLRSPQVNGGPVGAMDKISPRKSNARQRNIAQKRDSRASLHGYTNMGTSGDDGHGYIRSAGSPTRDKMSRGTERDLDRTLTSPNDTLTLTPDRNRSSERMRSDKQNKLNSSPREDEVRGMMLAMETNAADRSGRERSTGWGEESAPSMANPMYELHSPNVTSVTQQIGHTTKRIPPDTNSSINPALEESLTEACKDVITKRTGASVTSSRRGSWANRKSWDGVRSPEEEEENRKISSLEQRKGMKSNSDSNLMNLPKEQQKSIQMKLKASQELYDLHQHSKNKGSLPILDAVNNNHLQCSRDALGYEIEMEKSGVGLGLSIEGGCDTDLAAVRVKHIKAGDYAARKCGKLRQGQEILAINGQSVEGMTNGIATLTLRLAYSDPDTSTVRLLVCDR